MRQLLLLLFLITCQQSFSCISIYDSLKFNKKGICEKTFVVFYHSLGRDNLDELNNEYTDSVKEITANKPITAIDFQYKEFNYYLSIKEKCTHNPLLRDYDKKILCKIRFFNQLHSYDNPILPYGLVIEVSQLDSASFMKYFFESIYTRRHDNESCESSNDSIYKYLKEEPQIFLDGLKSISKRKRNYILKKISTSYKDTDIDDILYLIKTCKSSHIRNLLIKRLKQTKMVL